VAKPVLPLAILEAQIHAARLEILEVRTARDFEVSALSRRPDFQIVGLRRAEGHVTRAQLDHAIMEAEQLENALRVCRQ
jgi:hypothetical protein